MGAAEWTSFSQCGGHATPEGVWHHHLLPSCLLVQLNDYGATNPNGGHSPQIGWSYDGFPIYGPHCVDGNKMYKCTDSRANPSDCLDECNGQGVYTGAQAGGHAIDGYTYHYHVTGPVADLSGDIKTDSLHPAPDASMSPYTIGCWRGNVPSKPAIYRRAECLYPGTTADFVPRVVQGVSEYIYPETMPPTTWAPSSSPTAAPTECESISRTHRYQLSNIPSSDVSDVIIVNGYRDDGKDDFAAKYPDCIAPDEVDDMDYVYKIDYKQRKKKLTINIIVCCGAGKLFSAEQLSDTSIVPNNYFGENAAFHVFFIDDDDTSLGAKEIVVICIICLLVIAACAGIGYWYKQKRRGQASFDESKNKNETKKETAATTTTTIDGAESSGTTKIEMPNTKAIVSPVKDVKESPLISDSVQNDPYKVVNDDDAANITVR